MRIRVQYKVGDKILADRTSFFKSEEQAEIVGMQLKRQILSEHKGYKTGVSFGPPTSIPAGYVETPQAYAFALKGELIYTEV